MVFDLDATPTVPDPGAVVPFVVEIPNVLSVEGVVVRPEEYGPGGHALQFYDGSRGFVTIDHDSPEGAMSIAAATVSVDESSWLADLLGASETTAEGFYLEKLDGHVHVAVLH